MTKKIFRSIFSASLIVLLCCLVIILGVLYEYFTGIQKSEVKNQAYLLASGVEYGGEDYLNSISDTTCRITWISSDGTVLFDNETSTGEMENHLDREEIIEAMSTGYGEAERYSVTLMERQVYSAVLLEDGSVVRASVTQYTMLAYVMIMLQPIIIVIVAAVVISLILASRLSKRIVEPLNRINLDEPLKNEGYDELAPLMTRLENQQRQISRQLRELSRRKNEFEAITGSMNEGLLLISDSGEILSINNAAIDILKTTKDCVGRDILTVQRSLVMQNLIKAAKECGHSEAELELDGKVYQLDASAINNEGSTSGMAILIFDISDKVKSEQMRREFTANVSHELKTPLHSILGCAELLVNKMVKAEDIDRFHNQIYFESQRMVTLVDDIIHLSRLDEASGDYTYEKVSLMELCQDTVRSLEGNAKASNITIEVEGEDVVISSVKQFVGGIIYNLCDNAIKYNKENGSVTVTIGRDGDFAVISVADTGIGIPERHLERIFERFYRVDKSHSRKIGGTGLGLSIVKHSVQLLNGKIDVKSTENVGTTMTVRLPIGT